MKVDMTGAITLKERYMYCAMRESLFRITLRYATRRGNQQ